MSNLRFVMFRSAAIAWLAGVILCVSAMVVSGAMLIGCERSSSSAPAGSVSGAGSGSSEVSDSSAATPTGREGSAKSSLSREHYPDAPNALPPLPEIRLIIAGRMFNIEVADEDHEREQGLMYRKSMPADHGMIFAWGFEEYRGFWMANTQIPLDLIYLDGQGRVISIHRLRPYDRTSVRSPRPARYALELNAGIAQQLNLKLGDSITLPDSLR
jgi:uncharacterized membrane protein (UPF0127 family)